MTTVSSIFLLLLAPILTACLSQADIQARYNDDNEGCRSYAESNIERYLPQGREVSNKDRNAQMVTLFSDCMGKQGWQVAKPRKADELATTAPLPSPNYPGGYPPVTAAVAPVGAPVEPPAPAARALPPAAPSTPPASGQLPGWPQQSGPPPATYQPSYGIGPGLNF